MDNSNDNDPITVVEFCAGYGGLGLGIKRVLGERMRLIGLCELEGFAQANLISKMEAGLMAQVPIWSNLLAFPYRKFRGLVDFAVAGIPCQPHSLAGKRKGGGDERFLFDDWLRGLEQMQPRYILIENVEGLLSSKMPDGTLCIAWTIERLEAMGYKATAGIFSAREVGAPHQRKRVFILGVNNCERLERFNSKLNYPEGRKIQNRPASLPDGTTRPFLSNALRDGSGEGWLIQQGADGAESVSNGQARGTWPSRPGQPQYGWEPPRVVSSAIPNPTDNGLEIDTKRTIEPSEGDRRVSYIGGVCTCEGASMGDTTHQGCGRLDDEQGEIGSREARGHLDRASSTMGDSNSWRQSPSIDTGSSGETISGGESNIEQTECGQTQPPLGRDADGASDWMDYAELCVTCDNRTDELRLLGNGVVPATAERAFRTLLAELIP